MTALRLVPTADLDPAERRAIRALLDRAFGGDFDDDDWDHSLGGLHVVVGDGPIAHASVVPRALEVDGHAVRAGYVEAVATEPARQGEGHGTAVMRAVTAHIADTYDLGALSTGSPTFYERLGWTRWAGPTYVDVPGRGRVRTPEDDDGILVLRTVRTPDVQIGAPIACEWRPGDGW